MVDPVQLDRSNYYEGKTTREMIEDVRRWLGVSATDANRYSDVDVVRALNIGQERFAALTKCLTYPAVVVLRQGRQHYRLPYNSLAIKSARYYTSSSPSDYVELILVHGSKRMQRIDSQMRGARGEPRYLFPSYRGGNVLWFGLSPIPSRDGEVWDADEHGVLRTATGFRVTGNVAGYHKSGYPASAFLVDSAGRDLLALGVMVGYPVYNTTDGSAAIITEISNQEATNDKVVGTLTGGSDNVWDSADSFLIPMSEFGVVLDVATDETYTVSSYLGTVFDITGGAGNLVLDIARKPIEMSVVFDEFRCELPAQYHEAPIAYAVYWLGRGSFKGLTQSDKSAEGLSVFNLYVNEYLRDEFVEETDPAVEDRGAEWLS